MQCWITSFLILQLEKNFQQQHAADPTRMLVKEVLVRGWPERKTQFPVAAKPFWVVWHNLAETDDLLING
jgi:hypothetical protein